MSLILEALRKSEAERRRGQTPDLLSDAAPAAPAARAATRNASAMVAVAVAALVTLLLVAWWLRPAATPRQDPDASAVGSSGPAAVAVATPAMASEPLQPRATLRAPTMVATTAARAKPATAELPPPATPASTPSTAAAATPRADNVPPSPAITAPGETSASTELLPAAAIPIEPPVRPPQPAFTSPDVPLRLADLPTDERQQLPALKVSMHMWASDPASRFAIIDGARVNEGDRVGDATVRAIQQDGVLLAWRGRSIRLPIR